MPGTPRPDPEPARVQLDSARVDIMQGMIWSTVCFVDLAVKSVVALDRKCAEQPFQSTRTVE